MENHKDKTKSAKTRFRSESRLRVGKVLASYNTRPKTIPLIKFAKEMCLFYNISFFQNKLNKNNF